MIPRRLNKGDKFGSLFILWNQLIEYLHSIRLVAGKGIRISRTSAGMVVTALPNSRGRSVTGGDGNVYGSFGVSFADEEGKLDVAGGFVCVNGKAFTMKKQQIDIQAGLLCVKVVLDEENGRFTDPILEYGNFDEWHYPIAEITQTTNGEYEILQYPVTVAMFMITKTCVFAKVANGE